MWYDVSVVARDVYGNQSVPSASRFRTLAAPDTVAPIITPGSVTVNGISESGAWVRWKTDELSQGFVGYAADAGPAAKVAQQVESSGSGLVEEATLTRDHAVGLEGLAPGTVYGLIIGSVDASGNAAQEVSASFETAAGADVIDPQFTLGPGVRAQVESADVELAADEVVTVEVRYDVDEIGRAHV